MCRAGIFGGIDDDMPGVHDVAVAVGGGHSQTDQSRRLGMDARGLDGHDCVRSVLRRRELFVLVSGLCRGGLGCGRDGCGCAGRGCVGCGCAGWGCVRCGGSRCRRWRFRVRSRRALRTTTIPSPPLRFRRGPSRFALLARRFSHASRLAGALTRGESD